MNTFGQSTIRTSFLQAASEWRALSGASKAAYNVLAEGQGMTGYNLYIKQYLTGARGGVGPTEYTIQPNAAVGKDNKIVYYTNAYTWNFGIAEFISICNLVTVVHRILIEFDVSTLVGHTVVSATLGLYYYEYTGDLDPSGLATRAYRLKRADWEEGTKDSEVGDSCWNNYKAATPWETGGASGANDYDSTMFAEANIPASAANWWEFDVKTLIADAIANRSNKLILRINFVDEAASPYSQVNVRSSDYGTAIYRPKITGTYT